ILAYHWLKIVSFGSAPESIRPFFFFPTNGNVLTAYNASSATLAAACSEALLSQGRFDKVYR
ncbi:MAG: hypothetical protein AAGU32_10100, partial [Bacillota bacterium]